MSSLFKSGFLGLNNSDAKPFILDANKNINNSKIIRPIEEKNEIEEEKTDAENDVLLSDAVDKAKSIREDAIERASKILSDAETEAEMIKENAHKEGYEKGLEEGNMEAMKRADAYLSNIQKEQDLEITRRLNELISQFESKEKDLVDVCCGLVQKLTGILVDDYKPVMLHMINNALESSEMSKNIIIKISQESFGYIEENRDRISGATNPGINLEIYGDSKLERGQCIIESDNGIIDLSMDVQVRNLITAIKLLSN